MSDPFVSLESHMLETDWEIFQEIVEQGDIDELRGLARAWLKDVFDMKTGMTTEDKFFLIQEITFLCSEFSWEFAKLLKKNALPMVKRKQVVLEEFMKSSRERLKDVFVYAGVLSSS